MDRRRTSSLGPRYKSQYWDTRELYLTLISAAEYYNKLIGHSKINTQKISQISSQFKTYTMTR